LTSGSADEDLYRPCVGLAIFNRAGLVFLGRRERGPETGNTDFSWQLPQGGIDPGEEPRQAVMRELYEETNIRSASVIGEAEEWLRYDLPARLARQSWRGRYKGQRQRWFALRFDGDDSEIDVRNPAGGQHKAEFTEWRWERLERIPELVIPFKRDVYEAVVKAFGQFAGQAGTRAGQ
jgi:putative (di)nucleoside polyphosphate hydrolase